MPLVFRLGICLLLALLFFIFFCILSLFPFVALLLIGPPEDWFVYVWQDG